MDTITAIRTRRTHKVFSGDPIPKDVLEVLLDLAIWAPNHRMTQPWRFFVVPHEGVASFTEAVLAVIRDDDPPKLQAKRSKLEKRLPLLGAFVAVTQIPQADPRIQKEDYAAVSAGIQNLMVGATALGFGSFWSTGTVFDREGVRSYLGIPDNQELVGAIWLGVPAEAARSARQPLETVVTWVGEEVV